MKGRAGRVEAWVQRNLPTQESLKSSRWLRPFAKRIFRPELWRFTRRSVPRGVALGMITGIAIPFAQIFFAALFALPVRANIPVAALVTFVSNPLTTPLIWLLAFKVGEFILRIDSMTFGRPVTTAVQTGKTGDIMQMVTGTLLPVTAFGLVVLSVIFAAVGYLAASFFWRWRLVNRRRRRLAAMAERDRAKLG